MCVCVCVCDWVCAGCAYEDTVTKFSDKLAHLRKIEKFKKVDGKKATASGLEVACIACLLSFVCRSCKKYGATPFDIRVLCYIISSTVALKCYIDQAAMHDVCDIMEAQKMLLVTVGAFIVRQ